MADGFGPHALTRGVNAEIACAIPMIKSALDKYDIPMIVTSVVDRSHSRASLHYIGNALDIAWLGHWQDDPYDVCNEIFLALNGYPKSVMYKIPPDYDVVFEGNHIHIEFQPKIPQEEYTRRVRLYLEEAE